MFDRFTEDVRTAREIDPAAKSTAEVLLYAGLHAVWIHRLTHWLWNRDFGLAARAISQFARFLTGVEIHPAADFGRRVFIDHGMGVVIGETAEIGDDVNMYHGVTLGGSDPRPVKRHPTVESDVSLGANSTLVGDITIGEGATVGAGAVVVDDVPPGATVVGNPARQVDDGETDEGRREDESGREDEDRQEAQRATETGMESRVPADETAERDATREELPPQCCGTAGTS